MPVCVEIELGTPRCSRPFSLNVHMRIPQRVAVLFLHILERSETCVCLCYSCVIVVFAFVLVFVYVLVFVLLIVLALVLCGVVCCVVIECYHMP